MASVDSLTHEGPDARRRCIVHFGLGVLGASCGSLSSARDAPVHVVVSGAAPRAMQVVEGLRQRGVALVVTMHDEPLADLATARLTLALGAAALRRVIDARTSGPLLSALASREAVEEARRRLPAGSAFTAIYAEASPASQMQLIQSLFRRTVRVGFLLSSTTATLQPELERAAQDFNQMLHTARLDGELTLTRQLLKLAAAEVLLIFPDSSVFTPTSIRELLETSYRRRQPVIGFNDSLVAAGTIASAFSSAHDTVAHLHHVLATWQRDMLLPPQYPKYWQVALNDQVARSLDVVVHAQVRRIGVRP